jgi:non-ribosomal peptide synthetase component E (peptide arylation enzyme)
MILGGSDASDGARTTLDDLFRRAGVRRPDAAALIDPENRESFTDGVPRKLTFAQADREISTLAARLRQLGLPTDAVVAVQLPNTVESVITLLALLRARMIAAPLPLLSRQRDMVAALSRLAPKAIITASRIGSTKHAELAMQAATELFPVRYVCAFGRDPPDGVVPLDDCIAESQTDVAGPGARNGNPAAHVCAVTFETGAAGLVPVARNQAELIAGGLAPFLEAGIAPDAAILSAIPPASFAGIALTLLPWLFCGGTLSLHHGFDPDTFAAQCREQDTIVLPGPAIAPLAEAGRLGRPKSIVALWRSPERLESSAPWRGTAAMVDVASFGEIGLLTARRAPDGRPSPIPNGIMSASRGATVAVAETARTAAGTLALRGPMVPVHAFPPGAGRGPEPHLAANPNGFVDTGFGCRLERDGQTLNITGAPGGILSIGGYRFRERDVDAQVAGVNPAATIVALPDAQLGQRLAGSADDDAAISTELRARGVNPLITAAFRQRRSVNAA